MAKNRVFTGNYTESLARFDPELSALRMLQTSFDWADPQLLDHLPRSGMIVNGLLYAVDQTSEPHTEESAGFVLPTPMAQTRQSSKMRERAIERAKKGIPLGKRLQKNGKNVEGNRHFTIADTLIYQMNLPTPTCHDIKNNMSPSCWNRDADLGVEIAKMAGYTQDSIIGKGLRIHPHFITWMMGFPIDWLD